jgi:hypothetical protein
MTKYLVVEGPVDAAVMRTWTEAAQLPTVEILIGGGKSAATSLAKSIALSRGAVVGVLVDADTTERRAISEQRRTFTDLQGPAAGQTRLFLAIPTLEEALFPDAEAFVRTFKVVLTKRQRDVFERERKRIIISCLTQGDARTARIRSYGKMDVDAAQRGFGRPLLKQLFEFLAS